METLLRNLREYWSVDEHWNSEPDRVDCNNSFDRAIQKLARAIQEIGARLTHDPLPVCTAKEFPLIMLFQNFIGNAIKYGRLGTAPDIHVRAQKQDSMWHFSVSDSGIELNRSTWKPSLSHLSVFTVRTFILAAAWVWLFAKESWSRAEGRIWAESGGQGSVFHFTLRDKDGTA